MTQRTRGNDNIISIFDGSRKIAESEKSLSQRRAREPITVRVESVTARFCLNKSLWRVVTDMCDFDLRDHLLPLGVKSDDWYLSEDHSIVLMCDDKEYPKIKDKLVNLLLRLHRNSLEQQAPIPLAEDPAAPHTPSSP